jgi:hypothetical protein
MAIESVAWVLDVWLSPQFVKMTHDHGLVAVTFSTAAGAAAVGVAHH